MYGGMINSWADVIRQEFSTMIEDKHSCFRNLPFLLFGWKPSWLQHVMDITYQTTPLLLIRTKNNYIGTRSVSKLERLSLIWTLCERCSRSNLQMNRRPLDVCFIFDRCRLCEYRKHVWSVNVPHIWCNYTAAPWWKNHSTRTDRDQLIRFVLYPGIATC